MADQGQSADLLWSSDIRLDLLGPVRLASIGGEDLTPKARKTRALLAVLALSKSPVSRTRLADLLWGDRGEEQARASLRQALYELRAVAGGGYLSVDREAVGLGPKRLPTDVASIQGLIEGGDGPALAEALELSELPFCSSIDGVTSELDEWLREERGRIDNLLVSGGVAVAEKSLCSGDAASARRIADQLERLDPLNEHVARIGIRADLAAGDRAAGVRRHSRIKARLKEELGLDPCAETEALLRQPASDDSSIAGHAASAVATAAKRPRWTLAAAVAAILILIAAAAAYILLRPSPAAATPTVAVLPFEQIGQKNSYLAEGVSDEILNLLAHENRIRVLGRITSEQIERRPDSLEAARRLGITHLLDGSVQSAGNRLQVIVRLTRVSDGAQLWSERYERQIGDIFAIQRDIASGVAAHLSRSLTPTSVQWTSPEVYDRYLAARQLVRERREVTLREAERLLREAIRMDPHYAPAFAELSQVIMLEADNPTSYGSIPVAQAQAMAEPFARKAVELDPNLGDGYAALGFLSLNLDGSSEPYMRKAAELSPQRPEFHRWHAQTLMALGRYDEGLAEFKRAVDIDPLWELTYDHLIGALYRTGRREEGRAYARRFLGLSTDQRARLMMLSAMAKLDFRLSDQLQYSRKLEQMYPDERQMRLNLASSLAELGETAQAARIMGGDRLASAALTRNWSGLAAAATAMGSAFWYEPGFWNVPNLLVASGHGDALVKLYDVSKPAMASGRVDVDNVARPEVILALREAGRPAEADRLLQALGNRLSPMPHVGLIGDEKSLEGALLAALRGNGDAAIRNLDELSRRSPLQLAYLPAMSLRRDPAFAPLASDARFVQIDERVRDAINGERVKAGLQPIGKEAWIGDSKTLLTKN